jgi:signal transduction histidine kinase
MRMVERRKWHWVDWALFGILTSWMMVGLMEFISRPELIPGVSLAAVCMFVLVCYSVPFIFWRPGYVNRTGFPISILMTSGALEIYLTIVTHSSIGISTIPIILIGFLATIGTVWWTIPVFLIGSPIFKAFYLGIDYPFDHLIEDIFVRALVFGLGFFLQRILNANTRIRRLLEENRKQYQLIREQNKGLEQYSRQVEKLTLLEERNRMARELHDTVGHTFTSVIMGMDAVSYLVKSDPDKALTKLDVLREVTRNGLEEVRHSIHSIARSEDEGTLSQQLARLANEFAVHTGTRIGIRTEGNEAEVSKQAQLTLSRCLQESLTNAKRHGHAQVVMVCLAFDRHGLQLRVEDDGVGFAALAPGFGLKAMQERISALQGTLEVTSSPGAGTRVLCAIPLALPKSEG